MYNIPCIHALFLCPAHCR